MTEEHKPTPKWLKKLVRQRMAETGEKYTQALRRLKEEGVERRPSSG